MDHPPKLLIADDKESIRDLLEAAFSDQGYELALAADGAEAIRQLKLSPFDVVITDLQMPEKNGIDVLRAAKETAPDTEVIVITAYGTVESVKEAMRLGAFDYISKPLEISELERKVQRILQHRGPDPAKSNGKRPIVGESGATKNLHKMIQKIGASKSSVLITGESGTGKELVARALHEASERRNHPFVALNCAALASGVLESELFGHEKGAFTGSVERRIGRFEQADKGTLFLDEVGDIDPGIQTKLLRVLQEGEIERVGGAQTIKVDVRIIAATNRDLRQAIHEGTFREDFYYRLNVFSLHIEPLRNRRDDIPVLVDHFLTKFSREMSRPKSEVTDGVMEFFMRYTWPGNVRELENILERAAVLADGRLITNDDLPQEILWNSDDSAKPAQQPAAPPESLTRRTDDLEIQLIKGALEKFRWNKTKAAEHLGLKRTTLQYKIRKYGIE